MRDGVIHGFVHNAARNPKVEDEKRSTSPFNLSEWRQGLDIDATGAMLCAEVFKQGMVSGSSMVLVSSMYGVVGPDQRIYPDGFIKPAYYSAGKDELHSVAWLIQMNIVVHWSSCSLMLHRIPQELYSPLMVAGVHGNYWNSKIVLYLHGRH